MEPLCVFPLADHYVVLRPGPDRLALLNPAAWEVLIAARQGLGAEEIGKGWIQRFGLQKVKATATARDTLEQLRESGMLGPASHEPAMSEDVLPRARTTCSAEAPPSISLRMGLHPLTLRFGDDELAERLGGLVEHLRAPDTASGPHFEVLRDGEELVLTRDGFEVFRASDLDAAALALAYHVGQVAQRDETQLFVLHASGIAWQGRCVALAGTSGSGKSTLTTYLSCHGYDYLSDDMLPIDESTLLAEPAPSCIGLKSPVWSFAATFRPDLLRLPELQGAQKRLRMLPPPLPSNRETWRSRHELAALVFVEFSPGAAPTLERIEAPSALQALIDSQAYFARPLRPERIEKLVHWIQDLPSYRLRYADLDQAAELLEPLLEP